MRYHLIPVGMAKIKNTRINSVGEGDVKRTGPSRTVWWKCKLVQLWKIVWWFLKKIKIEIPYNPISPLHSIYTNER